jgi:hypothetical protein
MLLYISVQWNVSDFTNCFCTHARSPELRSTELTEASSLKKGAITLETELNAAIAKRSSRPRGAASASTFNTVTDRVAAEAAVRYATKAEQDAVKEFPRTLRLLCLYAFYIGVLERAVGSRGAASTTAGKGSRSRLFRMASAGLAAVGTSLLFNTAMRLIGALTGRDGAAAG